MWLYLLIIILILLCVFTLRQQYGCQPTTHTSSACPQVSNIALFFYYLPIFLVRGLVPAILSARHHYGSMFSFRIVGMKRRIYFLTDITARSAISRSAHLRLPAGQVARVFGVGPEIAKMFAEYDYNHMFATILPGNGLKEVTKQHSMYLQKSIHECLDHGYEWTESGLFHLCQLLVYESIMSTLYGSSTDSRSIVNEMKTFDVDVHLFAYPSAFLWFRSDLVAAKQKIVHRLTSIHQKDLENSVTSKLHASISQYSNEDIGSIKTALLWAAFGNLIPAIFWTYYHLHLCPKALEAVLYEINNQPFSLDDDDLLQAFPCLNSVIEETLRLKANALVLRECMQDIDLTMPGIDTKISLVEKDIVVLFPFALQAEEKLFPRSNEFIYDRFLVGSPNEVSASARRAHAPFGEGKFICPGRYLGRNVLKLTLIAMLKQFEIQFSEQHNALSTLDMLKNRQGFGIPPPVHDIPIRYRVKSSMHDFSFMG